MYLLLFFTTYYLFSLILSVRRYVRKCSQFCERKIVDRSTCSHFLRTNANGLRTEKMVNLFKFRRIIFIYEGDYDRYHNRNSLLIQLIRKKEMTKK